MRVPEGFITEEKMEEQKEDYLERREQRRDRMNDLNKSFFENQGNDSLLEGYNECEIYAKPI